jgi:hypothetical protein
MKELVENLRGEISRKYSVYASVPLSTNLTLIIWFLNPESPQLHRPVEIGDTVVPLNRKFHKKRRPITEAMLSKA